jgi:undecaprenyl-diphosphatase
VARAVARHAAKPLETATAVLSWIADEKFVLVAVAGAWAYFRFGLRTPRARRCGDQMLCNAVIAAAAPHLVKRLVDRERPDRKVVGLRRHGIPRSGNRWDSFPSGHAVHVGALASALDRFLPSRWRLVLWPSAAALAATRLLLLAHYVTDVAAGLLLGAMIDRLVARLARPTPAQWPARQYRPRP